MHEEHAEPKAHGVRVAIPHRFLGRILDPVGERPTPIVLLQTVT